jgi:hypothetical protein
LSLIQPYLLEFSVADAAGHTKPLGSNYKAAVGTLINTTAKPVQTRWWD